MIVTLTANPSVDRTVLLGGPLLRGQPPLEPDSGVSVLLFEDRRPFHPQRLHDAFATADVYVMDERGSLFNQRANFFDRAALIEQLRTEREQHVRDAEAAADIAEHGHPDEIVPGIRDPFKRA